MLSEPLINAVAVRLGRDISVFDESFIMQIVNTKLAESGIQSATDYGAYLLENQAAAECFYRSLHVVYSEFFREPMTFALLERLVLPDLISRQEKAGKRELRIWCAACAAGQEAYSLAMLLDEGAETRQEPVPYRIFGTDINDRELSTAVLGEYDYSAVQQVSLKRIRRYFTQTGDRFQIHPYLMKQINFSVYDLLEQASVCPPVSIFGDFDLIMISNLLFYFQRKVQQLILTKLSQCLTPGGYLVMGEVEKEIVSFINGLQAVAPFVAVFQNINHRR